jgi:probable addiction module antidote protein
MAKKLDPKKYRDNPTAIAGYLTESFEKNDLATALDAIRSVMRAQNVQALSEFTGLRRDNLYRTFRGKADPLFSRILAIFAGLDIRFVVQPLPLREKPPRPKLGRPPSSKKGLKTKRQAGRERSLKALARSNPRD